MSTSHTAVPIDLPYPRPARAALVQDAVVLALLGLVIGLACRGHFVMPYADFFDYIESGHALLAGTLPASLKRPPVFGVLVVGLSRFVPLEAAERVVAEWLNALLLPVNGLLVYLVGRRWFGPAARWVAAWFLLLPIGMFCTAHLIAEPLLTAFMLLTLWAAQRGTNGAYVLAALATMTRYDAAGLILGVALADRLRGRRMRAVCGRAAFATTPLGVWMLLTAFTWSTSSQDHYLTRAAEQWQGFRPLESLALLWNAVFDPELGRIRAWSFLPDQLLPRLAALLGGGTLILGAARGVRQRDAATVVAVIALAGYALVHALIPFRIPRYGYPAAPLALLLMASGLSVAGRWFRLRDPHGHARRALLFVGGVLVVVALLDESRAAAVASAGPTRLANRLQLLPLLMVVLLWAAPLLRRGRRLGQIVLVLGVALLTKWQISNAAGLVGRGDSLRNEVAAALWIRTHAAPHERALAPTPGLLRLYVGREPPDRFVSFGDIVARTWPDILAECRTRGIRYIIWHEDVTAEYGDYYAARSGLERFALLAHPDDVPGIEVVQHLPRHPNLVILRVTDANTERADPPETR